MLREKFTRYVEGIETGLLGARPEPKIYKPISLKERLSDLSTRLGEPDDPNYPYKGLPGNIQKVVDDIAIATSKKIWRGMVQSAAGGFGKGATVAAIILLAAATFSTGGVAALIPGLFTLPGMAIIGGAGMIGAVSDIAARQNKITGEIAEAEAKALEVIREQRARDKDQSVADIISKSNFAARELSRTKEPAALAR